MEQVHTISETVANGIGILEFIRDNAVALDWTAIDDQVSASKYVILYSEGHSKNNGRCPCYLKVYTNTTNFNIEMFTYWDTNTHIGYNRISSFYTVSSNNIGTYCDTDSNNSVEIKGNKDFILFSVMRSSNSTTGSCSILRIDNPTWDISAQTQTTVSGGLNTIMQLGEGQANQFKINVDYRLVSSKGHIDKVRFNNINLEEDQVTISELHYTTLSGSVIGANAYPWITWGRSSGTNTKHALGWAENYRYTSGNEYMTTIISGYKGINGPSASDDVYNHDEKSIIPFVFYELSYGSFGTSSYFHHYYMTENLEKDKIGINVVDTGSVSSANLNQITDSNKAWEIDTLKNMGVIINSGEQEDVTRHITGNTSDTLTVSPAYTTVVSGSENFTICEAMYSYTFKLADHIVVKDI